MSWLDISLKLSFIEKTKIVYHHLKPDAGITVSGDTALPTFCRRSHSWADRGGGTGAFFGHLGAKNKKIEKVK